MYILTHSRAMGNFMRLERKSSSQRGKLSNSCIKCKKYSAVIEHGIFTKVQNCVFSPFFVEVEYVSQIT